MLSKYLKSYSTTSYAILLFQLLNTFKDTDTWEFALIRYALLNYFQDSQMKMGEMIRNGMQLESGRFALLGREIRIPLNITPPGCIRYFEKNQVTKITTLVMHQKFLCLRKEVINFNLHFHFHVLMFLSFHLHLYFYN